MTNQKMLPCAACWTRGEIHAVFERIHLLEEKLSELLALQSKADAQTNAWLDSEAFCAAVGIKNKVSLHYYMSKGVIHGDAIRNIGTVKRPRYRFHRVKAVNQFLNRTVLPS
jgi:hypothetical protein